MLFMVISTPRAEHPSSQIEARKIFWPWMAGLQKSKRAHWCYARPGRGSVALFDVKNIEELHQYLNEWADMIPAQFEIYPLLDATNAKAFLATGATEAKAQKSGGIAEIIDASAHRHVILSSPNPLSCLLIAGRYLPEIGTQFGSSGSTPVRAKSTRPHLQSA